ncbi:MAG: hypothetical protein AABW91_04225 [Nanoarchaeota archaeon]
MDNQTSPDNIISLRTPWIRKRKPAPYLEIRNSQYKDDDVIVYLEDKRREFQKQRAKVNSSRLKQAFDEIPKGEIPEYENPQRDYIMEKTFNTRECAGCGLETNFLCYFTNPQNKRKLHGGYCSGECFNSHMESLANPANCQDEEIISALY